jgi:hypothetical protein
MKLEWNTITLVTVILIQACSKAGSTPQVNAGEPSAPSPVEAEAIATDAYIYAYPMLENYRTMYVQAIDRNAPGYLAPFNQMVHKTELLGPEFKDIVRPNNDTMYSFAWLNLRAQPMVLTVPEVKDRYYSVQLIDMFTHNFGYIGTRATGGEAGSYVVAGPQWEGTKPGDTQGLFRSQSEFVYCIIRTEVRGPKDVEAVHAIQRGYSLTPMNVFLARSRAPAASGITFPIYDADRAESVGFIDLLNFLLTQVSAPQEAVLMERFSRIGIQRGAISASMSLAPETLDAIEAGIRQAFVAIQAALDAPENVEGLRVRADQGWEGIDGLFGDGDAMRKKYLARAAGAMVGLYGNDSVEAYYPVANRNSSGDPLDASRHRYQIRFERDEIPQVDAFWSMTMYSLPDQLMAANPIGRYSIGDRSDLVYGKDGSLTIYVQHQSPGGRKQSNWLPAPDGPFSLQFRMYLPKPEALDPLYLPPGVQVVD